MKNEDISFMRKSTITNGKKEDKAAAQVDIIDVKQFVKNNSHRHFVSFHYV
jgi:hypothetical protein